MSAAAAADERWALDSLARARRLRSWMYSVLAPTRPGPAVEIGAGIGTFSELLLEAGCEPLLLVEPDEACAAELQMRFRGDDRIEIAVESVPSSTALRAAPARFAYALCQNVLEHIDDDGAALAEVVASLAPGGELAVLVPAHPALFGRLDTRFGHVRRYTRSSLVGLLAGAGLELDQLRSFNLLGVPGWWIAGRTGLVDISDRSLGVYEALVRVARPLEDRLRPPLGLSLVARARKPVA